MQSVVITNFCPDDDLKKRFELEPFAQGLYRCDSLDVALRGSSLVSYYKKGSFVGVRPKDFWPEAVFFDMDSTLIEEESGVVLAESLGIKDEMDRMTEAAMRGEICFEESFRARLRLLKGLSMATVVETFSQLHLHRGVSELCFWLKQKGIPIFVISGGFSVFCEYIAQVIGAEDWHANKVDVKDNCLTGELTGALVARRDKRVWFEKICRKKLINPAKAVMIGDGANDKDILEVAGLGVGFQPKEVLYSSIHVFNGTESHKYLIDFFQ